jgi:enolase-phosphatase E1
MLPPSAVITDIEGTTTPISFVHDVLFPYARKHLPDFLRSHAGQPDVAQQIAEIARLAPGYDPLVTLLGWMDEDAKIGPLKSLQGMIWEAGYADGSLKSELYPDVAPNLRRWHDAGIRLYVYSSGSVPAQKLLFRHAGEGNLEPLFSGFFDTATGPKREAGSYAAIARAIGLPPAEILFLSDVEAELDAATAAGMRGCQLVRPQDGTRPSVRHATAADFAGVAAIAELPA